MTTKQIAKSYELTATGLTVDGFEFPWLLATEGPLVEDMGDPRHQIHVLWVPIIADKGVPIPMGGSGTGEPVEVSEP